MTLYCARPDNQLRELRNLERSVVLGSTTSQLLEELVSSCLDSGNRRGGLKGTLEVNARIPAFAEPRIAEPSCICSVIVNV